MTTTALPSKTHVTKSVLCVNSSVICRARHCEPDYYELIFAPDPGADAPRTILLTRNVDLYEKALQAEGTFRRFDIEWHHVVLANRKRCQVIDALEEAA